MLGALLCFNPYFGYSTVHLKEPSIREAKREEDSRVETLTVGVGIFFHFPKNKIQGKIMIVKKVIVAEMVGTLAGPERC